MRLPTLAATAVAFFMAQSVPDAFTTAGLWFAISYVIVRAIGLGVQFWVIAGDQKVSVTRWTIASQLGIVLVLVGGFLEPGARVWVWGAAFAADIVAATLAGRGQWLLEPGHFAERHGLIVIIALGESLIAAGVASSGVDRDPTFALTVAGAVIAACALWWAYFGILHSRLERSLADQGISTVGRFARDVFSFWHAVVVAGVIGIAVGFEEAIAHPSAVLSTGAAFALTGGTALYLGGLAAASWRAGVGTAVAPRLSVALLMLIATPVVLSVPAPVALWGMAVAVAAMDVIEANRSVRVPA